MKNTGKFMSESQTSIEKIISVVCKFHDVSYTELKSRKRTRRLATARMHYGYLARKHTDLSLAMIGFYIRRDHATVLHYVKTIKNWVETYEAELQMLHVLERMLISESSFLLTVDRDYVQQIEKQIKEIKGVKMLLSVTNEY